ncbi:MAG: class I SAM-dependent methyltransferase [Caulobacterales bacterium]|nr:class I SAM-dependent methyltransferase [Caulobacterales bacterium]
MSNGWEESSEAWIKSMGENGDKGRQYVIDPAFAKLLEGHEYKNALDVGCGEGRLCRILAKRGIKTTGIDPTKSFIEYARKHDKINEYIECSAEKIPLNDNSFDLVISCLSLIDIPNYKAAIREMTRVLKPKGDLLIANLTSFNTAGAKLGWQKDVLGKKKYFAFDDYMIESENWEAWNGIKIINHHRPLSSYMQCFLENGLLLRHFDEPIPVNANAEYTNHIKRVPWFVIMKWQKQ